MKTQDGTAIQELVELLRGRQRSTLPPYLNERRQLRIYLDNELVVLKPNEVRYWNPVSGLNDADTILADDWLGTDDASTQA